MKTRLEHKNQHNSASQKRVDDEDYVYVKQVTDQEKLDSLKKAHEHFSTLLSEDCKLSVNGDTKSVLYIFDFMLPRTEICDNSTELL